ncbi:hypothetical protein ACTQZS_08420 [Bilifractor sp. LCP19S3_H10]|uniref:hypothetical protein n=1 Tax=Bilifractor sp. LCP19S3_H10 TaxID=3438736 RepID=UPI003F923F39
MFIKLFEKIKAYLNGELKEIPDELMNLVFQKSIFAFLTCVIVFVCAFFMATALLMVLLIITAAILWNTFTYCHYILEQQYDSITEGEVITVNSGNLASRFTSFLHNEKNVLFRDTKTGNVYAIQTMRSDYKWKDGLLFTGYVHVAYTANDGTKIVSLPILIKPTGTTLQKVDE